MNENKEDKRSNEEILSNKIINLSIYIVEYFKLYKQFTERRYVNNISYIETILYYFYSFNIDYMFFHPQDITEENHTFVFQELKSNIMNMLNDLMDTYNKFYIKKLIETRKNTEDEFIKIKYHINEENEGKIYSLDDLLKIIYDTIDNHSTFPNIKLSSGKNLYDTQHLWYNILIELQRLMLNDYLKSIISVPEAPPAPLPSDMRSFK